MIPRVCTPPGTRTSGKLLTMSTKHVPIFQVSFLSRGSGYHAPPSLGASSRPNEVPLSALQAWPGTGAAVGGTTANSAIIEAHLAVQATIRSYQVCSKEIDTNKTYICTGSPTIK